MTKFAVHTIEGAPVRSRPLLEGVKQALGFVPNLYGVFAESPAALQGAIAIWDAFSHSSLSSVEQQLVVLAVSEANDCEYCVAAHSTLAKRMARIDPRLVDATRRRTPLADAKLDALVNFTRKVVERRGLLAEVDVAAFFEAGYTRAQVLEVL